MKFMIIEKSSLNLPANVSSIFESAGEAKEYGYTKPKRGMAKVIKIDKGFKLIDNVSRANAPSIDQATQVTKEFDTGKITLYVKDSMGYCEVENL
ncbi:MAG: hypothetical protein K9N09_01425 [Candidatus Cloacimonetes bacterium]|nr:hypothetical protein [Candidatus Cloacimonadota bacterium]MCF7882768.1 hypothetical protein [Candidatus Cloacimonadota bacterium]